VENKERRKVRRKGVYVFVPIQTLITVLMVSLVVHDAPLRWALIGLQGVILLGTITIAVADVLEKRRERVQAGAEDAREKAGLLETESKVREDKVNDRKREILTHRDAWGEDVCQALLRHRVSLNMTPEMVALALGKPSGKDRREIAGQMALELWVYGVRSGGARYFFFKNGTLVKMWRT
jgi:TRAP-type uncharacterized transport system fused permease subunit